MAFQFNKQGGAGLGSLPPSGSAAPQQGGFSFQQGQSQQAPGNGGQVLSNADLGTQPKAYNPTDIYKQSIEQWQKNQQNSLAAERQSALDALKAEQAANNAGQIIGLPQYSRQPQGSFNANGDYTPGQAKTPWTMATIGNPLAQQSTTLPKVMAPEVPNINFGAIPEFTHTPVMSDYSTESGLLSNEQLLGPTNVGGNQMAEYYAAEQAKIAAATQQQAQAQKAYESQIKTSSAPVRRPGMASIGGF